MPFKYDSLTDYLKKMGSHRRFSTTSTTYKALLETRESANKIIKLMAYVSRSALNALI